MIVLKNFVFVYAVYFIVFCTTILQLISMITQQIFLFNLVFEQINYHDIFWIVTL